MEQPVSLTNEGQRLAGTLHTPEAATPYPAVAMFHGFTGSRIEAHCLFVKCARDLAAHGIGVLRFDFRGSGESEGEFRDMTIEGEISDALRAVEFLSTRPGADNARLGVIGLSMGGCVAACTAARSPLVKAAVLWSAVAHPDRFDAFGDQLARAEGDLAGAVDLGGNVIGATFVQSARHTQPLLEIAKAAGPVLVVHGADDNVVSPHDAEEYVAAVGGRARLHIVAGADHTFSGFHWEREVFGVTRSFLLETL